MRGIKQRNNWFLLTEDKKKQNTVSDRSKLDLKAVNATFPQIDSHKETATSDGYKWNSKKLQFGFKNKKKIE